MDNLKACLECPICAMVPRKMKIFSCLNGHDICEHCFDSIGRGVCPQGDCSYGVPGSIKVRARKLEKLIESAEFVLNCRYARAGCLSEGLGKDLDKHEVDCSFRTVPCLQLNCEVKACLSMLDNHLAQRHLFGQVMTIKTRKGGWKTSRVTSQTLQKVKNDTDRGFLFGVNAYQFDDGGEKVYLCLAMKNKTMFTWLTQVASPSQAMGCISTIRISDPANSFYIEVQCPVASIDTPPSEVLESGNCLAVTGSCLEKLSRGTARVEMSFKIQNI